jgi:hypothetical protein
MSAPIQNLTDWLSIATDDLCAAAKERIRLEIESHFQEAVDTHRADGQSEEQAQANALKDLGNPEVEGKRFRKTHLTEDEAERLAKRWASHTKWSGKVWVLVLSYSLFPIFSWFLLHFTSGRFTFLVPLIAFDWCILFRPLVFGSRGDARPNFSPICVRN